MTRIPKRAAAPRPQRKVQTTMRLSADLLAALTREAEKRRVTRSALTERALIQFVQGAGHLRAVKLGDA